MANRPTLKLPNPGAVNPHLNPGDVVMANFPESENPGEPGEKLRPCVVEKYCPMTRNIAGVYVTRASNPSNSGGLVVDSPEGMKAAGFDKPSRIVARRVECFKNNSDYVSVHPTKGATIGKLSDEDWEKLCELLEKEVWSKLMVRDGIAETLRPSLLALSRGWVTNVLGLSLEINGVCHTLRVGGDIVVNFWPEDPARPDRVLGVEGVTREMVIGDTFLSGHDKNIVLAQIGIEDRKAS